MNISQEARDAAAELGVRLRIFASLDAVIEGRLDHHPLVQAFQRAIDAERERCARVADGVEFKQEVEHGAANTGGAAEAAAAIRGQDQ